ncbi:MAG: aminotransferase class I/II-fold pyridoxal phosphate-dependent enzyme [Balneolaceae bacterium]
MNRYTPYLQLLKKGIEELDTWRELWGSSEAPVPDPDRMFSALEPFLERLKGNYPFHHPAYAGQMLKPPHPAAWLAYTLAMTINPNNHALDGGPPTSEMEKEAVGMLCNMAGFGKGALGHLTSGGTVANLEALWIARELHPDKSIASSASAHYTHERMCRVLKARHITIPELADGKPDPDSLYRYRNEIGTLVVTLGTTGLGKVEPLEHLLNLCRELKIRVHVDAAYGGFYKLIAGTDWLHEKHWSSLPEADSIVIDPHKHGLQPYGCGCVLFRDPSVTRFYRHDSPYTYFSSEDLHLGEISLECSRSGAAAAALWFTFQMLPLTVDGLGSVLISCRKAALNLAGLLNKSRRFRLYMEPQLDIVCYFPVTDRLSTGEITAVSKQIFRRGVEDREKPLFVSLITISADEFSTRHPDIHTDTEEVTILRSVLMKPEHESCTGELFNRLENLALEIQ